jgi:hypothetical protein
MSESARSGHNSARTTAAVLIFVFGCLLSSERLVLRAPSLTRLKVDDISQRSDQRFASLQTALPPRGVIGYVGEPGDDAIPDYYLAQYALAPRVVDHSPNHSFVIGNFPHTSAELPVEGLKLVKDFGNGVFLFSNEDVK